MARLRLLALTLLIAGGSSLRRGDADAAARTPLSTPVEVASAVDDAEIAAAVSRGLAFLASTQHANGCWTGDVGHKQMDDYLVYVSKEMQDTAGQGNVGVTALAGLAFLANGQVPGRGPKSRIVEKTIGYVLDRTSQHHGAEGYIADSDTRMYEHAFATLFLSQAFGMTPMRRADVERKLKAAVALIVDCQNQFGAWRYGPYTSEADLSVTVCQVQALRAARDAGIAVPKRCIDRVLAYIQDSRIPSGSSQGCFYYKIRGTAAYTKTSFAINAAAATALQSAGIYEEREYARALDFIEAEYPTTSRYFGTHFYFWYGNYYAAQAMRLAGGERWNRYWPRLVRDLLGRQLADGRWRNDTGPGDEFATAVACLILQIPNAWLPIFQK